MWARYHIIASFSASAILYAFTRSVGAGLLCFGFGFLVDLDHIIEYIIHFGAGDLSVRRIYEECRNTDNKTGGFTRLYLLFHIGEIGVLFWLAYIFTMDIYILAIAVGYSLHLIMDAAGNCVSPQTYFISWRLYKRFRTKDLYR